MQKKLLPTIYPVACHTNNIGPGSTFVAISGYADQGTNHIQTALQNGAKKIIVEHNKLNHSIKLLCAQFNANLETTGNARQTLAHEAAKAQNFPAKKLKIIGITGTKGKTSTTFLIDHILRSAGYKTGLIGGVKNQIGDIHEESILTTPNSDYLQMFFSACVEQKIDYVVMEVTAHALSLDRVHDIEFEHIGFTNLSHEHMDFYQTINDYFHAKLKLLNHLSKTGVAVVNIDNVWGKQFAHNGIEQGHAVIDFERKSSNHHNAKAFFTILENNINGITININNELICSNKKLFGIFNAQNIIMAALLCKNIGLTNTTIQDALQTFSGIPGRLQQHVLQNGGRAFVDFAHAPDAVEQILKTLRPLTHHLIVVFGCGGDRDKSKRPIMGSIVQQYADLIIITDDNPRTENREKIAHDIVQGITNTNNVVIQLDRALAIAHAVNHATKNSIIAILGKGHETYYLVNNQKYYFNDFETIQNY